VNDIAPNLNFGQNIGEKLHLCTLEVGYLANLQSPSHAFHFQQSHKFTWEK